MPGEAGAQLTDGDVGTGSGGSGGPGSRPVLAVDNVGTEETAHTHGGQRASGQGGGTLCVFYTVLVFDWPVCQWEST